MQKALKILIFLLIVFSFSSCKYFKKYTFTVVVKDEYGEFPIRGVTVQIKNRSGDIIGEAETNNLGFAIFEGSYGTYFIHLEAEGYLPSDEKVKIVQEEQEVNLVLTPLTQPAGGIINARVLNYTSNSATFELTFFFAGYTGTLEDNLTTSDVRIDDAYFPSGHYYDFTMQSLDKDYYYGGNYSVAVAIDQSGSIASTDPSDSRIIGAKMFFANLSPNYARLFAFASGGQIPYDVTYWGDYTSYGFGYFDILDMLKDMEGGGTPLYKAAYLTTNDVYEEGPVGYKYVLLFTDGEDTDGSYTIDDVIDNANDKGVTIHTVGLGPGTNLEVLAKMAYGTGGFLIKSANQYQLVTVFRALSILMANGGTIYKGQWHVDVDGDVFPGWFETSIDVDYNGFTFYIPFHVDVPNYKLATKGESKFQSTPVKD